MNNQDRQDRQEYLQSLMAKKMAKEIIQEKKEIFLKEKELLPFLVNEDQTGCNLHPFYKWQQEFYCFADRLAFLTAANQIGKSSILIIKMLNLAMRPELWPHYFGIKTKPSLFLYLYPDGRTGATEFYEKWEKVYLPKGEMKDHPKWGWKVEFDRQKQVEAIRFNSGVTILWRYYTQKPSTMQAMSIDFAGLDEECPLGHWDELMVRTSARAGLGSGLVATVFTATLGQSYLFDTMERQGEDDEKFPNAFKRQISLYDCLYYVDGTPSEIFTKEHIEKDIIPMYSTPNEIKRRVWGRFVKDSGLLYGQFNSATNLQEHSREIIEGWQVYAGIDYGSGGASGHPSSIAFVAVDDVFFTARVMFVWKSEKEGNGYIRTTQSDLLNKYLELKKTLNIQPHTYFDWHATDLGILALREGISMLPANKNYDHGVGLLNSLFKSQQLKIFTGPGSGDTSNLIQELETVNSETLKKNRKDDCADALRYALSSCPMRITKLVVAIKPEFQKGPKCKRMRFYQGLDRDPLQEKAWGDDIDEMLEEAQELFGD